MWWLFKLRYPLAHAFDAAESVARADMGASSFDAAGAGH